MKVWSDYLHSSKIDRHRCTYLASGRWGMKFLQRAYEDRERSTGLAYHFLPVPGGRCDTEPNILAQWAWGMRQGVKTEDKDHLEYKSLECRDCLVRALVFSAQEVKRADCCWTLG